MLKDQRSNRGYKEGYIRKATEYKEGYEEGYNEGCKEGHKKGYKKGYKEGYKEGFEEVANNHKTIRFVSPYVLLVVARWPTL